MARLRYSFYPESKVDDAGDSINIGFQEIEAGITVPVRISDKLAVLTGIYYAELTTSSNIDEFSNDLHFISLNFTWAYLISEKNSLIFLFYPSVSSSLEDPINGDDFLIFWGAIFSRKVSEQFNYGIGAVYTPRLGRPMVLPIVRLNVLKENFYFEFNFPQLIQAKWNTSGTFSYGIKMALDGSQFSLADDAILRNSEVNALNFSRTILGPEVDINIINNLYFTIHGGFVTNRRFNFISDNGPEQDINVGDTGFVSATLSLKINPNSK